MKQFPKSWLPFHNSYISFTPLSEQLMFYDSSFLFLSALFAHYKPLPSRVSTKTESISWLYFFIFLLLVSLCFCPTLRWDVLCWSWIGENWTDMSLRAQKKPAFHSWVRPFFQRLANSNCNIIINTDPSLTSWLRSHVLPECIWCDICPGLCLAFRVRISDWNNGIENKASRKRRYQKTHEGNQVQN